LEEEEEEEEEILLLLQISKNISVVGTSLIIRKILK
jgi:hypothetical protein